MQGRAAEPDWVTEADQVADPVEVPAAGALAMAQDREPATVAEPTETAMDPAPAPEVVQGQDQGPDWDPDQAVVPLWAESLAGDAETDWEPQGPDGGTDSGKDLAMAREPGAHAETVSVRSVAHPAGLAAEGPTAPVLRPVLRPDLAPAPAPVLRPDSDPEVVSVERG